DHGVARRRVTREGTTSPRRRPDDHGVARRRVADHRQRAVEVHRRREIRRALLGLLVGLLGSLRGSLSRSLPSILVLPSERAMFLVHGSIVPNLTGCAQPRLKSGTPGDVSATRAVSTEAVLEMAVEAVSGARTTGRGAPGAPTPLTPRLHAAAAEAPAAKLASIIARTGEWCIGGA